MEYLLAIGGFAVGLLLMYAYMNGRENRLRQILHAGQQRERQKGLRIDVMKLEMELQKTWIDQLQAGISINAAWREGIRMGYEQADNGQTKHGFETITKGAAGNEEREPAKA